jgi:L-lactate dehydrogenase (cytochrome)
MTRRRLPRWTELRDLVPRSGGGSPVARASSIEELRDIGRRRVPRAVFDYVDGGSEAEISLHRNRAAFRRVELIPHVLHDVSTIDLSTTVLGRTSPLPVVLAPTGYTRMMHHEGEPAVARAAGRAGLAYALSTMGTTSIEDLVAGAPDGRKWFQLYLWRDRAASEDLVARAAAAGCDCLILTVDTALGSRRLRDIRNGLTIPPSLTYRTLLNGARHPRWWVNLLTTPPLRFASMDSFPGTVADLADRMFDPSLNLDDLDWLRALWPGKLVVKGVQTLDDAKRAADHGCDGIVVSNHGGRQLDRSPTPLEQVSAISAALDGQVEVYVDGGVMNGGDVIAAVGLGARAVLVGRAYLYGLMAGGEVGVDRAIEVLRAGMDTTMRLMGVTTLDQLKGRVHLRAPEAD